MLHRIGTWLKRTRKRLHSNERGITTLDWIGLTAVVVTLLTAIIFYGQTGGAQALGARVGAAFNCQIARWEGHGGRCGGEEGNLQPGQPDTKIFSPGKPPVTSPAVGIPQLLIGDRPDPEECKKFFDDSDIKKLGDGTPKSEADILAKLKETKRGREIAEWIEEHNYKIEFAELPPRTMGTYMYGVILFYEYGDTIYINSKYRDLPLEMLASTVGHEGQHAINRAEMIKIRESYFLSKVPILGWFFDRGFDKGIGDRYREDPAFEEYSAFRAEAEILKELQEKGYALSEKEQRRVNLIFDSNGDYRDPDVVQKEINQLYLEYFKMRKLCSQ